MVNMAFFFLLFSNVLAHAQLTPFQKSVAECLSSKLDKNKIDVSKTSTLEDVYSLIDKQFSLRTTETIFREVEFKKAGQAKKLKLEKGLITIHEVGEDGTLSISNNDARQKGLTDESSINQLLVGADIRSDWLRAKETRSGKFVLHYSRQQGKITSLTLEKAQVSARLECSRIDLSDVCLCRP